MRAFFGNALSSSNSTSASSFASAAATGGDRAAPSTFDIADSSFVVSSPAWKAVTRAVASISTPSDASQNLAQLSLAAAALEDAGALVLCQALKARESTSLTLLDLSNNGLSYHAALAVKDVLKAPSCKHVRTLVLSDNPLMCAGTSELATMLAPAGSVTHLEASRCGIADVGAAALAAALAVGDGVSVLELDGNGAVTPAGFVPLVAAAASLSSLRTLHVAGCCKDAMEAGNALGGALDAGMVNLTSLRYGGGGIAAVLRGAVQHTSLLRLDLSDAKRLSPAELHEASNLLRVCRTDLQSFQANVGNDDDLAPLVQAVRLRPMLEEVDLGPGISHAQSSAVARALAVNRYVRDVANAGGDAVPLPQQRAISRAVAAPKAVDMNEQPLANQPHRKEHALQQHQTRGRERKDIPILAPAPAPAKPSPAPRGTPSATAARARSRERGTTPAFGTTGAARQPSRPPSASAKAHAAAPAPAPAPASRAPPATYLSAHPAQAHQPRRGYGANPRTPTASRAAFSSSAPGRMGSPPSPPKYSQSRDDENIGSPSSPIADPSALAQRILTQVEARLSRRTRESEARVSAQIDQASTTVASNASKALASLEQRVAMLSERVAAADGKAGEASAASAVATEAASASAKTMRSRGAALMDRIGRLEHDAASAEEVALLREEMNEMRVTQRRLDSRVAMLAEVVEKEEATNRRFLEALLKTQGASSGEAAS
ncbi:hypothetical protein RI054_11g57160 [Pseudoscourfieldia marina]